ncbi:MAG: hypothetical protein ACI9JL_003992 [Paracoccaceae bacterium]|jgi:hypothetical protein
MKNVSRYFLAIWVFPFALGIVPFVFSPSPANAHMLSCADEGGACKNTTSHNLIRYGLGTHLYLESEGLHVSCNNQLMGDPAYGAGKWCQQHRFVKKRKSSWKRCGFDDDVCELGLKRGDRNSFRQIRYGSDNKWVYRYMSNDFKCGASGLGISIDPQPGQPKECWYSTKVEKTTWKSRCKEGQSCSLKFDKWQPAPIFLVRYGNKDKSKSVFALVSGPDFKCDNNTFKDPAHGQAKTCEVAGYKYPGADANKFLFKKDYFKADKKICIVRPSQTDFRTNRAEMSLIGETVDENSRNYCWDVGPRGQGQDRCYQRLSSYGSGYFCQ